jgi:hypothetical protein
LTSAAEAATISHGWMGGDGLGIRRSCYFAEEMKVTVADRILEHLRSLPEPFQAEVLEFVEHLETKAQALQSQQEDEDWSALSLSQAMRGLESEPCPYSTEDIREVFS